MLEYIRRQIISVGLDSKAEELIALARPAITFDLNANDDSLIPVGSSKFGGKPDLPDNVEWPNAYEVPYNFVFQLNTNDLQEFDCAKVFPKDTLLYFFMGLDLLEEGSVVSSKISNELKSRDYPEIDEEALEFVDEPQITLIPSATVSFKSVISMPSHDNVMDLMKMSDDELERYEEFYRKINSDRNLHQIFGYDYPIQAGICSLGTKPYELILQLDEDESMDVAWADGGLLYFGAPQLKFEPEDLKNIIAFGESH